MFGPAVGVAFFGMGIVSLVKPEFIYNLFGITSVPVDAQNEVRAVYGGFGIVMSYLLIMEEGASYYPGILLTSAMALSGMAGGRILSTIIDKTISPFPLFCLFVESFAAYLLFISMK